MIGYLIGRLGYSLIALLGTVTIVFIVIRLVPADPAAMVLGADASLEELGRLRAEMQLDRPIVFQFASYLVDLASFDFGDSYRLRENAMALVLQRYPATLTLAGAALVLACLMGIPLGVIAALRAKTLADRAISALSLMCQSLPGFWVGIVLIMVFSRGLRLFPSAGAGGLEHLVLPAFTLALPYVAILTRLTRSGLLEVIHEGYIQTARAKGLNEFVVVAKHAMRNALIPVITVIGLQFGILIAGAVIVETVFSWPGVGRLLIEAINQRDYNVVQAAILIIAITFLLINLIVDVLYVVLDPRVRISK